MPGIDEDIRRAEALGFTHAGFRGGAIEYQNYACPRTGLVLCIPLGDAPYIVQKPHPDYTELGRPALIDDAFALIARAPPKSASDSPASATHRTHDDPARGTGGAAGQPALVVRTRRTADRPAASPSEGAKIETPADAGTVTSEPGDRVRTGLAWIFVGLPLFALVVFLLAWELLPMLLMPALFVLGLGTPGAVGTGIVAGACWGLAASTWWTARNVLTLTGAALLAAIVLGYTGEGDELLGARAPLYGAMAAVSVVSIVLPQPRLRRCWMLFGLLTGAVVGGLLAAGLPNDSPRAALWLTAVAVHGVIATASARMWAVVLGESVGRRRG